MYRSLPLLFHFRSSTGTITLDLVPSGNPNFFNHLKAVSITKIYRSPPIVPFSVLVPEQSTFKAALDLVSSGNPNFFYEVQLLYSN